MQQKDAAIRRFESEGQVLLSTEAAGEGRNLQEYYDEMARDLQQRLRAALPERRLSLEEKLSAVAGERSAKLADVADRYQVRVELTLINLRVIVQPKLVVPIDIANRGTSVPGYAVWDPLLHRLEPLACAVCGLPGDRMFLCHHGHLAHRECLAPACVDCKRVFCASCAEAVGSCAVCRQPLCRYSCRSCQHCGRGTCQAHEGLCHAAAGQPVDLQAGPPAPAAPEPAPLPPPEPPPAPPPAPRKPPKAMPPQRMAPRPRVMPRRPPGVPKAQRLEVVIEQEPEAVVAYVLAARERQVAARIWELRPEGIAVFRRCELGPACRENNLLLRPVTAAGIERQLLTAIDELRQEYGILAKRVHFNQRLSGRLVPQRRFVLHGRWKDDRVLDSARVGFYRLR